MTSCTNILSKMMYIFTCTHVVIFLLQCCLHLAILSRQINVDDPILFLFRNSTHFCPTLMFSTTMLSRAPQAVEIATSYFSSIAPKSPCKEECIHNGFTKTCRFLMKHFHNTLKRMQLEILKLIYWVFKIIIEKETSLVMKS